MQIGNRGDETKTKAVARRRAAPIEPDEALQHAPLLRLRDPRPSVCNHRNDTLRTSMDTHLDGGARRRVVKSVLHQIGKRLGQQIGIAANRQVRLHRCPKRSVLVLGYRAIGFVDATNELREIDRSKALTS